jgi:hypothetical protein
LLAGVAALSLVTMPITAIWFLYLGPIVGFGGAIMATLRRTEAEKQRTVRTTVSIALGLLAGPFVYLALALLVAVA